MIGCQIVPVIDDNVQLTAYEYREQLYKVYTCNNYIHIHCIHVIIIIHTVLHGMQYLMYNDKFRLEMQKI